MPCRTHILPGGQRAIVCMARSRPKKCVGCGRPADLLCDWKVEGGTCDAPICATCSTVPAPGKDLCPDHARTWETWKAERQSAPA